MKILWNKFLAGVTKFVPIIVQTEGLFPSYGIVQFNRFAKFLKELKQHLEEDTIEDFLKHPAELDLNSKNGTIK